jgi:hypothetical protein
MLPWFPALAAQDDILEWRMSPLAAKTVSVAVAGVAAIALELYFERWWSVSIQSGNLEFYHAPLSFVILFGVTFAICNLLFRLLVPANGRTRSLLTRLPGK